MRWLIWWCCCSMTATAAMPDAVAEREAVRARWTASQQRDAERYQRVLDSLCSAAEKHLASQQTRPPEVGRWGGESEWRFRTTAQHCLVLAVCHQAPGSRLHGDPRLLAAAASGLDFLAAGQQPDGRWHSSDTNVSRFCLAPATDAGLLLDPLLPADVRERWLAAVQRGGAYQIASYYPRTGSFGSGHYPNMDGYFAVAVALAGVVCGEPTWLAAAADVVRRTGENCLLADGAYEYVDGWNPVPVYQDIMPLTLGRYYLLTGDREAERQLRTQVDYYPAYSEVSGATDNGMTPFIKHYWGYEGWAAAPELVAHLTGDGPTRAVADRRLHWLTGDYPEAWMLQWISRVEPAALPTEFMAERPGVEGFAMRTGGRFTAWLTGRRTAHDTLVSVVASDPVAVPLRRQALAAVLTEVVGLPEPAPTGAMVRFTLQDQPRDGVLKREFRHELPASDDWREQTIELPVPAGCRWLRLDLFQFFQPGAVQWDDVALLQPDGADLLTNGEFERIERGRPAGWGADNWGTAGESTVIELPGGGRAVRCSSPDTASRSTWTQSLAVPAGATLRLRLRYRTESPGPPRILPALVYYLTDMEPAVAQFHQPGQLAVQRLGSRLHAMGPGVRYPTPVDGTWRWSCWTGGSPDTAPWQTAQTWILAGGRLHGLLSLRCDAPGEGGEVGFRPVINRPDRPRIERQDGAWQATYPQFGLSLWPSEGLQPAAADPTDKLHLDLPDGVYRIRLSAGDPDHPLAPMQVTVGGETVATLSAPAGELSVAEFTAPATDRRLSLGFLPSPGEHWKLAALEVDTAAGNPVLRLDAGPGSQPPAAGYQRLDGSAYAAARGLGWSRRLTAAERRRGDGLAATLLTAPLTDDHWLAMQAPPGRWEVGQVHQLRLAVGPDGPPAPGADWGWLACDDPLVAGWWTADETAGHLVVTNETAAPSHATLALPARLAAWRGNQLAGQGARVAGGRVVLDGLPAGGLVVLSVDR